MLEKLTIAFIGGGNITHAMAGGLIKNKHPKHKIVVSDPNLQRLSVLVKDLGVAVVKQNSEAIYQADIVALAVKPHVVKDVCLETVEAINRKKPLVISLAAATCVGDIFGWFGVEGLGIVRTMTNLATSVGKGTTAMFPNQFITPSQRTTAQAIFDATGKSVWIEKESDFNRYSPLIGCGPAYLFLLIEALQKAAVSRGIPEPLAAQLALSVVFGAAELARGSTLSPEALRQSVTTPKGLTEASLKPIIGGNYFKLFEQAFEEAEKRGSEIEETNRAGSLLPTPGKS